MIVVCGSLSDPVTRFFCNRLNLERYPFRLLDLAEYPAGYRVYLRWENNHPIGHIACASWRLELEVISGVFVRYFGFEQSPYFRDLPSHLAECLRSECKAGLAALLDGLSCPVANRFATSESSRSKPYQALAIRQCGFRIPRTLITTDPEEVRLFYQECAKEVIFKSISRAPSIVRRLDAKHLDQLQLLDGPTQFQALVPGDNIRVHVVSNQCFAARIHAEAIDYRYASPAAKMEPANLPTGVANACIRLTKALGLIFSGIDLKETPEGEFYCFEVNTAPAFDYYELLALQPISAALCELLRLGPPHGRDGLED
jgi:RimK-like ATP-grasp domain